jgi:hypothetical protein
VRCVVHLMRPARYTVALRSPGGALEYWKFAIGGNGCCSTSKLGSAHQAALASERPSASPFAVATAMPRDAPRAFQQPENKTRFCLRRPPVSSHAAMAARLATAFTSARGARQAVGVCTCPLPAIA